MALKWSHKDPNEVLDYRLDWLGTAADPGPMYDSDDIISNSLWVVPDGVASESEDFDDGSTTIWLSGGTAGETYVLLNRITTADGRVFDQSVKLPMKDH